MSLQDVEYIPAVQRKLKPYRSQAKIEMQICGLRG